MSKPKGLWANIHAKQKRIANGSGERMRQPGSEGAPTEEALKKSAFFRGFLGKSAEYGLPRQAAVELFKNASLTPKKRSLTPEEQEAIDASLKSDRPEDFEDLGPEDELHKALGDPEAAAASGRRGGALVGGGLAGLYGAILGGALVKRKLDRRLGAGFGGAVGAVAGATGLGYLGAKAFGYLGEHNSRDARNKTNAKLIDMIRRLPEGETTRRDWEMSPYHQAVLDRQNQIAAAEAGGREQAMQNYLWSN
jgi:hypothetical protein